MRFALPLVVSIPVAIAGCNKPPPPPPPAPAPIAAPKPTPPPAPKPPAGKHGVALLGASTGGELRLSSPFGDAGFVGGDPPTLVFSVAAGTTLSIGETPVAVDNGKGAAPLDLDRLLTLVPTSDLLPASYTAHAKAVIPVSVKTPDGATHDETITLESGRPDGFVAAVKRLVEPVLAGKPIDLGPAPAGAGGVILVKREYNSEKILTRGAMASLRGATTLVVQGAMKTRSAGSCAYTGSRGRISVPVSYGSVELTAYDLRRGKVKKRVTISGSGSRCPFVHTTYGGSAGVIAHDPSTAQLEAAIAKLTK